MHCFLVQFKVLVIRFTTFKFFHGYGPGKLQNLPIQGREYLLHEEDVYEDGPFL